MKKVLIGTPAYDGRVDVWYANSLVNTIKLSVNKNIEILPIYMAYDSLVQRARNDLVRLAIDGEFDDLIFIDSDQEWDPEWVFRLLDLEEDVIGVPVVKKSDQVMFNVKAVDNKLEINDKGLMEVDAIGTGFMKISKAALHKVWHISEEYMNEGRMSRMVFDIKVVDGNLVSEDNIFCQKWKSLDGKIWIDPSMTCNHIGIKKYTGNFLEFLKNLQGATT